MLAALLAGLMVQSAAPARPDAPARDGFERVIAGTADALASGATAAARATGHSLGWLTRRLIDIPSAAADTTTTVAIDPGQVTTLAGSGSNANVDGTGSAASFANPNGVVTVGGYAYVASRTAIRKIDLSTGQVTTFAGTASTQSCTNGSTGATSQFYSITDIAADASYLYTADACGPFNQTVFRRTSFATGATSNVTAISNIARITIGPDGALYAAVTPSGSGAAAPLYRIDATNGTTTTVATWTPNSGYNVSMGAVTADASNLYVQVATAGTMRIDQVALPGGTVSTVASGTVGSRALTSAGDYLYGDAPNSYTVRRYAKSDGSWTDIAGVDVSGYADGTGTDARFGLFTGITSDGTNMWVSDNGNRRLRQVAPGTALASSQPSTATTTVALNPGQVTTFAGSGTNSNVDGTGTSASFASPNGAVVVGGYAYVAARSAIRKVDLTTGAVTTFAGSPSTQSCIEGVSGATSGFYSINDIATDGYYLYVADSCGPYNQTLIMRVSLATGATSKVTSFSSATDGGRVTVGPDAALYASVRPFGSGAAGSVYRIDRINGTTSTVATWTPDAGRNISIGAITADASGLYVQVATSATPRIDKVTLPGGTVSTIASGSAGSRALTSAGDYLYGDAPGTKTLRRYAKADGSWTDIAGIGVSGYADGTGTDARFGTVAGVASDGTNLWVADSSNYRLRKIVAGTALPSSQPAPATTTVAANPAQVGTLAGNGTDSNVDGIGTAASFRNPYGVAVVGGYAYVGARSAIRKVDLATGAVTTFAGNPTTQNCIEGLSGATSGFYSITDIATDGYYLYVNDPCGPFNQTSIMRVSLANGATSRVTQFSSLSSSGRITVGPDGAIYASVNPFGSGAAGSVYRIDRISGTTSTVANWTPNSGWNIGMGAITADASNLYLQVATAGSYRVDKIALPAGTVTTLASAGAAGSRTLTSAGDYLYGDGPSIYNVRRYAKADGSYKDIAGTNTSGYADGTGIGAGLRVLTGITSDGANLWVVDNGNYRLRKLVPAKAPDAQGGASLDGESKAGNHSENWCAACHADPVQTDTGNFFETTTDVAVPGRGPALAFARTYNSTSANVGGRLGYGWSDSYAMSLGADPYWGSGYKVVTQENGATVTFKSDGAGGWTAPTRVLATLVQNGDGTFTFTRRARDTFVFDASGRLAKQIDRNGYTTTLTYNGSGLLTTVTEPAGRTLTLTYGTGNRVATVTDNAGRRASYTYDASANLTDVTDVGGGNTHFTYDAGHLLLTVRDPRGNTVTTNTYDSARRVLTQKDALNRTTTFAYAPLGAVLPTTVTVTDPKGNVSVDVYDDARLVSETKGFGTAQAATTTYGYDPTLGVSSVTDPNNHTTTATYNALGLPLTSTDALNHTTTMTYSTAGDLLTATDPTGATTTNTYDGAGNLLSTSTPLVGSSPAQSRSSTFAYGDSGHPGDMTSATDPNAKTTTFTYNGNGDRTSATDPLGNTARSCFDSVGRVTATVAPKGVVLGVTCASSAPAAFTTYYTTNAFGDVLTTTDPMGHQAARTYDGDRNVVTSTDANGNQTSFAYDVANQLTTTTRPDTTVLANEYWPDGSLKKQIDAKNAPTTYAYDPVGRLSSVTDPLNRTTTYAYDGAGNQTSLTDAAGQTTTKSYDAANRLTGVSYSDGTTPNVSNITYDADGRRTAMTDGTGTSTWTWDSLHRLVSVTNGAGATVGYGHDLKGQVTSIVYPGTTGTVTRAYDDAGRLTSVQDWLSPANTSSFGYDANSNLVTESLPGGAVNSYTFNAADQPAAINDVKDTTTIFAAAYGRDNNGQLTSDSSAPTATGSYKYTALNQLCYAGSSSSSACSAPPSGSTPYGFDAADNVTTFGGNAQQFDAANQLCWTVAGASTNACDSPPTGATAFGYDLRGNRTGAVPASGAATCNSYDQANRLTGVTAGTGSTCTSPTAVGTYGYDGSGTRASKSVGGATTQFTWDGSGQLPLLLQETTGGATTSYIYGPSGKPLEHITSSGTPYWYHHDQLGSTRALSDSTGSAQATYSYDPYGNLTTSSGSVSTPLRFAGEYTDTESGLIYMRARYYDPATGQFISRDPLVDLTQSAYGYIDNNPLNGVDPSGLMDLGFKVPSWVPVVGGSDCIRIADSNCKRNPKNQQGADFAGGVLNGIALGHGRGVIDNFGPTRGKVDYCDHLFGIGTKVGYGVDAAAAAAAAAPVVASVAPEVVANPAVQKFAAGCAVGLGAFGVEYAASKSGAMGDLGNMKGTFESPVRHGLPECVGVGTASATFLG